ncbi:hypothetical protein [Emticicia sp. BO119]|uniref:hypothetical protein n=1 Tax=Emticicia sp. BO119 TaxID=2757768 RepID=UPI0015F023D2|nr:hypothetical protein [Emticicia sp. BO119]MBA4849023.1 hypothetical protein [Emticicia sp. BO119]
MKKNLKNALYIFSGLLAIGGLAYWYQRRKTVNLDNYQTSPTAGVEAQQLSASLLALTKSTHLTLSSGLIDSGLTTTGSGFPMINKQAPITAPVNEKSIRLNQLRNLVTKYDSQISLSAKETGVPKFLHYAIILHENPDGIATLDEGNGVGLGAITLVTPTDTIRTAMKKGRLTAKQIELIRTHASNATGILASSDLGAKLISKADLKKPELNITLIGIQLQNLLYQFGADRLPQVLFAYNRGVTSAKTFFSTNNLQKVDATTLVEKSKGLPYFNTGSNYVLNQLGIDGMLDLIVNDTGIKE